MGPLAQLASYSASSKPQTHNIAAVTNYYKTHVLLQSFSVARSRGFESKPSKKVADVAHDKEQSVADVREDGLKQRRLCKDFLGLVVSLLFHFRFAISSERRLAHRFYRFCSRPADSHFCFLLVISLH